MGLGLVSRSARAFSEHLNTYYRVLKGVDPDSVWLRLPGGGGSFEVRHSATAAPVLRVTDAGIAAQIGTAAIADGAITSAKIADGTIVGADIANNTITSNKIVTGAPITPGSITATELADGAVTTPKLGANAVSSLYHVTANIMGTSLGTLGDSGLSVSVPQTTGDQVLGLLTGTYKNSAGSAAINSFAYLAGATTVQARSLWSLPTSQALTFSMLDFYVAGSTGTITHKMQFATNAGSLTVDTATLVVAVLRR